MTVYLVGGGPGDPGLITVRGAEVLARADVVVYDRLSVASLLDLAPPGAERISVGKAPGRASRPQAEINALLVERGKGGSTVVRLRSITRAPAGICTRAAGPTSVIRSPRMSTT